jgi:YD repeat-containing protein
MVRFSYDLAFEIDIPTVGQITVRWGDGRRDIYTFDGTRWVGDPSLLGSVITPVAGGDYELRTKHGNIYRFDASGRLINLVDRNGNTWTLNYNGFGQLITITDPSGRVTGRP